MSKQDPGAAQQAGLTCLQRLASYMRVSRMLVFVLLSLLVGCLASQEDQETAKDCLGRLWTGTKLTVNLNNLPSVEFQVRDVCVPYNISGKNSYVDLIDNLESFYQQRGYVDKKGILPVARFLESTRTEIARQQPTFIAAYPGGEISILPGDDNLEKLYLHALNEGTDQHELPVDAEENLIKLPTAESSLGSSTSSTSSKAKSNPRVWLLNKSWNMTSNQYNESWALWRKNVKNLVAMVSDDYRMVFIKVAKNAGTSVLNSYFHRAICPAPQDCKAHVTGCVESIEGFESAEDDISVDILLGDSTNIPIREEPVSKCSRVAFHRKHAYFVHSPSKGCATISDLSSNAAQIKIGTCSTKGYNIPVFKQPTSTCKHKIFKSQGRTFPLTVAADCPVSRLRIILAEDLPVHILQDYLVFSIARNPTVRARSMFLYCNKIGKLGSDDFINFLLNPQDRESWGGGGCSADHIYPQVPTWFLDPERQKLPTVDIIGHTENLKDSLETIVAMINRARSPQLPPLPTVSSLLLHTNSLGDANKVQREHQNSLWNVMIHSALQNSSFMLDYDYLT